MSLSYITATQDETIDAVRKRYLSMISSLKNNDYIYVVNAVGTLIGVLSVKGAFAAQGNTLVSSIMSADVIKVKAGTRQERVAMLAMEHDFDSIPVTDKDGKLIGVIPSGVILDILYEENVEDFLKLAGIRKHEQPVLDVGKVGPLKSVEIRIPWLVIGLFGGILASAVIEFFQKSLTDLFILASFIPLIAYLSGAVSAQTTMLFIRLRATGAKLSVTDYLPKEVVTGALMGLGLGFLLFLYLAFGLGQTNVGIALWAALILTSITASLVGFAIPSIIEGTGNDPVIGAGPFGTIISDITSLTIYFLVSTLILSALGV